VATARIDALCTESGPSGLRGGKGQHRCRATEGEPWRPRMTKAGGGRLFSTALGGKDATTKVRAGQDIVRWHSARRKARLCSPPPRAWGMRDAEKPPSVIPFPPTKPPGTTTAADDTSAANGNGQHRRAHRIRTQRDAMAMPHNPARRRFLGISHNAFGLPNLKPGQDICGSKWHDRAKVGRKERSDWSRQTGVICSAALPGPPRWHIGP
jgi:hypothetical protein